MRTLSCCLLLVLVSASALAQREFGFDNRKASGQDYLSADESVKRFKLPPGWEVKVFASEPDVVNPVAFTIDERGRLWVVECFEYPRRTPKGKKPRDRIKILEDTDGDGKCDKVTTWAEGKDLPIGWDLATGIEVGHGGVFLGAAPYLFFLKDTKGTGKCDSQEILLKGFGSQDTHETLNTFTWGPDSKLYGLHGVFTHSQVDGVKMTAAVWRYDCPKRKFEVFAEGTSNPWGLDFDARGQCHLACCVIPHLFHMVPGGTYKRQAGSSFNPYAYGLLNESCDHVHHKESGWAHAGLLVLEGSHVPKEYQGSIIMGSIHGCSIKRDVLRRNGSTYLAGHAPDFLMSGDKNFRPINLRWGPDGSIYVIDWHDQNPCHQAPPDSWDMKHGRIYKIQRKGAKKAAPVDLAKKTSLDLFRVLINDNPYQYRTALRLLHERQDATVVAPLKAIARFGDREELVLRALWGLHAIGALDEGTALMLLEHDSPWVRSWAVRLLGEPGKVSPKVLQRFEALAAKDPGPEVRLQLASTAQRLKDRDALPLLQNLMKRKEDAKDPFIPLMIWLAYEPRVAAQGGPSLDWLKQHAPGNALVTNDIVPRVMRRLVATGKAEDLAACVAFLRDVSDSSVRRSALDGLLVALKDRQVDAPAGWKETFAALLRDADGKVHSLARRLAVNFQDREAIRRALSLAADSTKAIPERLDALRDVALARPAEGRTILQALLAKDANLPVRVEACRALAGYDHPDVPRVVLAGWKSYPPGLRVEAVNILAGRKAWAKALLDAVGAKQVPRTDLTDNTILRIRAFGDKKLIQQVETVWGRFRDTPAELSKLIDQMRAALHEKPASFERGRKVFDAQCAKCHKFDGRGHEVGPPLDGAARDIEYLLANVLDPNRVIGQPYYLRVVQTKDGRLETGLLHAEDDNSITLKVENDQLKVIQKKDIDGKVRVVEKSVMPEGLGNNMTVQDFRDLIRYSMAHPFLTEVAVTPHGVKPAGGVEPPRDTKWHRPAVPVTGRIPLPAAKADGVAYVVAEVTAPRAMKTVLQFSSAQRMLVLVNGAIIHDGKVEAKEAAPDQASVAVQLREGVNRIAFRLLYRGEGHALYARLLDPDRTLRHPEPR
ncbi:MAG: HEAT repeat domain-containing protein [Gemmataceae bacterium]|nr:HEAT repeat domain-containing protein [Gemmataceae bacterium]